jgi:transcriptional regulator with XRE-family HTH domain
MVVEDMAKGYSLTAFAGLIGVSRSTINEWMSEHPEFSEAVTRGKAARLRDWERVALDMRTNGGGPGGATITVFGLKNMGADEWSDTQKHELSGSGGSPIKADNMVTVRFVRPSDENRDT